MVQPAYDCRVRKKLSQDSETGLQTLQHFQQTETPVCLMQVGHYLNARLKFTRNAMQVFRR